MRSMITASTLLALVGLVTPAHAGEQQRLAPPQSVSAGRDGDAAVRREWFGRAIGHILSGSDQGGALDRPSGR